MTLIHIIDDDPIYGMTLRKILNVKKFENVELYSSSKECLENLNNNPELIILDYNLGDFIGLDLLKPIKESVPSAKVAFLTSHHKYPDFVNKCLKAGASAFFQKDEKGIEELIDWVERNFDS